MTAAISLLVASFPFIPLPCSFLLSFSVLQICSFIFTWPHASQGTLEQEVAENFNIPGVGKHHLCRNEWSNGPSVASTLLAWPPTKEQTIKLCIDSWVSVCFNAFLSGSIDSIPPASWRKARRFRSLPAVNGLQEAKEKRKIKKMAQGKDRREAKMSLSQ